MCRKFCLLPKNDSSTPCSAYRIPWRRRWLPITMGHRLILRKNQVRNRWRLFQKYIFKSMARDQSRSWCSQLPCLSACLAERKPEMATLATSTHYAATYLCRAPFISLIWHAEWDIQSSSYLTLASWSLEIVTSLPPSCSAPYCPHCCHPDGQTDLLPPLLCPLIVFPPSNPIW